MPRLLHEKWYNQRLKIGNRQSRWLIMQAFHCVSRVYFPSASYPPSFPSASYPPLVSIRVTHFIGETNYSTSGLN
jgi:hypothetical protein